jgi:hypothetical protein
MEWTALTLSHMLVMAQVPCILLNEATARLWINIKQCSLLVAVAWCCTMIYLVSAGLVSAGSWFIDNCATYPSRGAQSCAGNAGNAGNATEPLSTAPHHQQHYAVHSHLVQPVLILLLSDVLLLLAACCRLHQHGGYHQ